MTTGEWLGKGQFFEHKGHRIFYLNEGAGPVILLLHGFPTSSWDWYKVWPDLIKNNHAIAFDFVGFGYSDKPRDYKYSLMDQADIAEELLEELSISQAHVLAHDYGDTVAQELLARQNEKSLGFKIDTCALLNGGLFPGVHKPRLIQKLLMTPIGPLLSRLYSKKDLQRTFHEIFGKDTQPDQSEIDAFWHLMTHNQGKAVVHKLIKYMEERISHQERWLKALQQSTCAIRLINGAADPISGLHLVTHYKKVIPDPDCVILEGIGHYPQVEAPKEVFKHFLDFLKAR